MADRRAVIEEAERLEFHLMVEQLDRAFTELREVLVAGGDPGQSITLGQLEPAEDGVAEARAALSQWRAGRRVVRKALEVEG